VESDDHVVVASVSFELFLNNLPLNEHKDVCLVVRFLIPLLTIYDMCKIFDKVMAIMDIHLMKKTGGKIGTYLSPK